MGVDHADPVFEGAADRLDVMIFSALGQSMMTSAWSSGTGRGQDWMTWPLGMGVWLGGAAAEVDKLSAFAFGDGGDAGDLHAVDGIEESTAGFGDLHAGCAGLFGEADQGGDDEGIGGASLFGGIVDGLVGLDEDGVAGIHEFARCRRSGRGLVARGR